MMRGFLASVVLVATVAACSESTGPSRAATLTLAADGYAAGDTITATLANRSGTNLVYGPCSLELERFTGIAWVRVDPEPSPCIDIGYTLEPGATVPLGHAIPGTLARGVYRVSARIFLQGSAREVYVRTRQFRLAGAA